MHGGVEREDDAEGDQPDDDDDRRVDVVGERDSDRGREGGQQEGEAARSRRPARCRCSLPRRTSLGATPGRRRSRSPRAP